MKDFEEFCFKDKLSDCYLIILQEEDQPGSQPGSTGKRKRGDTLTSPGHSIVLAAASSYFKAKIENWTDEDATAAKPEMLMHVPAGQLEIGQLLIKTMYQNQPRLSGTSHQQLLQLLLMADRFSVPAVMPAVASAFRAIPSNELEWETALAMLDMPESCARQAAFKDIAAVAADRLQQQVGDLEQVWADALLTKQLLGLSEAAMRHLLQHQGTCVASENTIAYTVQRWYEAQNNFSALPAAVRLMRLVRMRHCTPLYVGTIMSSSTVFCSCFSQQDIALAALCCTASGYEALTASQCKVLDKYPAWRAQKRPATARQQIVKLRLELGKLKQEVESFLSSAQPTVKLLAPSAEQLSLQGRTVHLSLQLHALDSDGPQHSKQATLGAYLGVSGLEDSAVTKISFSLGVEVWPSKLVHSFLHDITKTFCAAPKIYGVDEFCGVGSFSSWDSLEAVLRTKTLVHSDGCLHLRATIREVE